MDHHGDCHRCNAPETYVLAERAEWIRTGTIVVAPTETMEQVEARIEAGLRQMKEDREA